MGAFSPKINTNCMLLTILVSKMGFSGPRSPNLSSKMVHDAHFYIYIKQRTESLVSCGNEPGVGELYHCLAGWARSDGPIGRSLPCWSEAAAMVVPIAGDPVHTTWGSWTCSDGEGAVTEDTPDGWTTADEEVEVSGFLSGAGYLKWKTTKKFAFCKEGFEIIC